MKALQYIMLVIVLGNLTSCTSYDEDDEINIPKPKGYFRIDFPKKVYQVFQSECAYQFEYPVYSKIVKDIKTINEPCWLNIDFIKYHAKIHLSYKQVKHHLLDTFLLQSRNFAIKHQIKATGIKEIPVVKSKTKVYGLIYEIKGNAASCLQFYLTDSLTHFLRGSLYFNSVPNEDSQSVVINYIKQDVIHMINTLHWNTSKKQGN